MFTLGCTALTGAGAFVVMMVVMVVIVVMMVMVMIMMMVVVMMMVMAANAVIFMNVHNSSSSVGIFSIILVGCGSVKMFI